MNEIRYKEIGTGNVPVVVMHEWMGDHSNYNPVLPYLNTEAYRWIFVDLRGYGMSKHLAGEFTCREAADDIHRLADALDFKSYGLIGHSMSAMVAQRIALDAPHRVKVLIAVTPVPASGVPLSEKDAELLKKVIFDQDCATSALNDRTGGRYNDTFLSFKRTLANNAGTVQAREKYLEMFLHTDFSADIKGLKIPVRVIVGAQDIPPFRKEAVSKTFSEL